MGRFSFKFGRNAELLFLFLVFSSLVFMARVLPHAPNFSPILAVCLWLGVKAARGDENLKTSNSLKILVGMFAIIAGMFLSDLHLNSFDPSMWSVYLSLALVCLLGFISKGQKRPASAVHELTRTAKLWKFFTTNILLPVGGATLFFILSNFAVWSFSGIYDLTWSGLSECYLMALPFYRNSLESTVLFYTAFNLISALSWQLIRRRKEVIA